MWTLYAAVLGFAVGASLFSSYPPPHNHQTTIDGRQTGAKNATTEIAVQKSADDRIADYTWWVAAFTCALVVISAVQIHFLLRSDETARIIARAAEKSANVAEKSLIDSRRAWLSIDNLKIIYPTEITEDGAAIRVSFTTANLGDTPATEVSASASHWLHRDGKTYAEATTKFMEETRFPVRTGIMGPIIFANKEPQLIQLKWFIDGETIKKSIRVREDGQKFLDFSLFAGIAYRIAGDDAPHLTFVPYDWLNVPIRLKLVEGQEIEKSPAPFAKGIAD